MLELRLPLDYERQPDFRILCQLLKAQISTHTFSPEFIEAMACRLWMRLWIELGYQAQINNQAGFIDAQGVQLFVESFGSIFGDNCSPLQLLETARHIRPVEGGYFCDRFASLNAHLAGNYMKKEDKGARLSDLSRNRQRILEDSFRQSTLLPPEIYKKSDGTVMTDTEINRSMVCITTIDFCLKRPGRATGSYTEGLIADAAATVDKYSQDDLKVLYNWLAVKRDSPELPKSTEKILEDVALYMDRAKKA